MIWIYNLTLFFYFKGHSHLFDLLIFLFFVASDQILVLELFWVHMLRNLPLLYSEIIFTKLILYKY